MTWKIFGRDGANRGVTESRKLEAMDRRERTWSRRWTCSRASSRHCRTTWSKRSCPCCCSTKSNRQQKQKHERFGAPCYARVNLRSIRYRTMSTRIFVGLRCWTRTTCGSQRSWRIKWTVFLSILTLLFLGPASACLVKSTIFRTREWVSFKKNIY